MHATPLFLFFLCATYAAYLLVTRRSEARGERLRRRVEEALAEISKGGEGEPPHVQLARDTGIGGIAVVGRRVPRYRVFARLDELIRQADLRLTVTRLLAFCALAAAAAMLAAYTAFDSWPLVIVLAFAAGLLPVLHVWWARNRRLRRLLEQLPDALDMMSRALAVGHALSEALHEAAEEMPEPVASEFRVTFEEQKLGLPLRAAFERMAERVPLLDLRLCTTAILLQRETGGNLAEILEKVAATIRERFRLIEDFRTITTASRGSAWILCLLPVVIVLVLGVINPQHVAVLFEDERGRYIVAAVVALQVLGVLTILRILAIRV
jgi:tight adherence protein B